MTVNREQIYQGIILIAPRGGSVDYRPFKFRDRGLFDYLIEMGIFNGFPIVGNSWLDKPVNLEGIDKIAAELSQDYKTREQ